VKVARAELLLPKANDESSSQGRMSRMMDDCFQCSDDAGTTMRTKSTWLE